MLNKVSYKIPRYSWAGFAENRPLFVHYMAAFSDFLFHIYVCPISLAGMTFYAKTNQAIVSASVQHEVS